MHFLSTILVCAGAHFSAVWIVVANSWQQTPAGYHLVGQAPNIRAEIVDFWQLVFNPSSIDRIWHVYMGAWQAGAFFVLSVSAFYILRNKHIDFAKASIKIALLVAAAASVLQLVSGHSSAVGVAENQPAKMAAFEAHYNTGPADLYLFGWVNDDQEKVQFGVKLPGMLSYPDLWRLTKTGHRAEGIQTGRSSACECHFPELSRHGGNRSRSDSACVAWTIPVVAQQAVQSAVASLGVCLLGHRTTTGKPTWLALGGGRTATLDRLQSAAHFRRTVESRHLGGSADFDHSLQPDLSCCC